MITIHDLDFEKREEVDLCQTLNLALVRFDVDMSPPGSDISKGEIFHRQRK